MVCPLCIKLVKLSYQLLVIRVIMEFLGQSWLVSFDIFDLSLYVWLLFVENLSQFEQSISGECYVWAHKSVSSFRGTRTVGRGLWFICARGIMSTDRYLWDIQTTMDYACDLASCSTGAVRLLLLLLGVVRSWEILDKAEVNGARVWYFDLVFIVQKEIDVINSNDLHMLKHIRLLILYCEHVTKYVLLFLFFLNIVPFFYILLNFLKHLLE